MEIDVLRLFWSVFWRVFLVVGSCCAVALVWRSLDGGVVRASEPAAIQGNPASASCCLIPANRGLHKDRP